MVGGLHTAAGSYQGAVSGHLVLALAMVEAGKARLIGQEPGEAGAVCTFETATGEQISLARPAMTEEMEAEVREMLREILDEGGV